MRRLLLVANPGIGHIGAFFIASPPTSWEITCLDMRGAWAGPALLRRLSVRLRKRPPRLERFSAKVLEVARQHQVDAVLTTGIAPVTAATLSALRSQGVRTLNFLTDDPWNGGTPPDHLQRSLAEYDCIYSPRTANYEDLLRLGCRQIKRITLAYDPLSHYQEAASGPEEQRKFACDVAFIGGGDKQRVGLLQPLLASGLRCHLYGAHWDRYLSTRRYDHGAALGRDYRLAVAGAKVCIVMGRAANRDGHAMRTFELPAMRASMLAEDTPDHREIFGPEGECVLYYRTSLELATKAQELCRDSSLRERLAAAAYARIATPSNTYLARLAFMLEV